MESLHPAIRHMANQFLFPATESEFFCCRFLPSSGCQYCLIILMEKGQLVWQLLISSAANSLSCKKFGILVAARGNVSLITHKETLTLHGKLFGLVPVVPEHVPLLLPLWRSIRHWSTVSNLPCYWFYQHHHAWKNNTFRNFYFYEDSNMTHWLWN